MSVRFCVRDSDGRRSAMWSVFAMGSNVGMTTTEAGGLMKVNLHESGSWQIGYTSEYEKRQREVGGWNAESRHWKIWRRPSPVVPGHTAALKVLVPAVSLRTRPIPQSSKRIRWVDVRPGKAVTFTIWLSRSTVPVWGYGGEHDLIATIPLPNGENVLVGAHHVDATDATTVMLKSLGGFVSLLMTIDTTKLDPLPMDATLMGLTDEPSGVYTVTEIALWALATAEIPAGSVNNDTPAFHDFTEDLSTGLMDVSVPIPPSVFLAQGIDPDSNPEAAARFAREWNEAKIREMRRLFQLPSSG